MSISSDLKLIRSMVCDLLVLDARIRDGYPCELDFARGYALLREELSAFDGKLNDAFSTCEGGDGTYLGELSGWTFLSSPDPLPECEFGAGPGVEWEEIPMRSFVEACF